MLKGLIFFENTGNMGSPGIINSNRPVVLVSNEAAFGVVQVVPLTTSESKRSDHYPTHIRITSTPRESVAVCEQLRTVPLSKLGRMPKGLCSSREIAEIDRALMELLGLHGDTQNIRNEPQDRMEGRQCSTTI